MTLVTLAKNRLDPHPLVAALNAALTERSPLEIVQWAYEHYEGYLVASTSFGKNSAVLLHMLANTGVPIIHIRTNDMPRGNRAYEEQLLRRLVISMRNYAGPLPKAALMRQALKVHGAKAILSGVRAAQNEHRGTLRHIERRDDGIFWIYPLLHLTHEEAARYIKENDLPVHEDGLPGDKKEPECGLHIKR